MFKISLLFLFAGLVSACSHSPKYGQSGEAQPFSGRDMAEYTWTSDRSPANVSEKKSARRNDVADEYELTTNGDFFRYVGSNKCQITNNVADFKISQHPNDAAMVYFLKKKSGNQDLYVLHNSTGGSSQCPKASTKMIMEDIKKYTVTSNTNTTIVNAALSHSGRFAAWDNSAVVYSDNGVTDYQMNQCFGVAGRSFKTYVLFTQDRSRAVTKVKVDEAGRGIVDGSKSTSETYANITEFNRSQNVCAQN